MATGPLRFATPHIEELPTTHTRQAPGFAWVAVSGAQDDSSKNWGTANRKRARAQGGGQTEAQKEAITARQQREIERKIKELNSDNSKDVQIPLPKREGTGGGASRAGKTSNTKKILASGKTFAHYLDDEEAEIARTGRRDGDLEVQMPAAQPRPSKTPLARRKTLGEDGSSTGGTPIPQSLNARRSMDHSSRPSTPGASRLDEQDEDQQDIPPLPTDAELDVLLKAPPLTYNQARSAPPPSNAPPPRRFCEVCGFFGRAKCMKCGAMTCSVLCKDAHDEHRCLKFYA